MESLVAIFLLQAASFSTECGEAITYTWVAPTENTDGTPLVDLDGYKLYYGTSPGEYTVEVDITDESLLSWTVDCLQADTTYHAVMTAYNVSGLESLHSNEASDTTGGIIPSVPLPPSNLAVLPGSLTVWGVEKTRNFLALIEVGTVPEGTLCDNTQQVFNALVSAAPLNPVPFDAVNWSSTLRSEVVYAQCGNL